MSEKQKQDVKIAAQVEKLKLSQAVRTAMQPVIDSDLEQIKQWPQDKAGIALKAYKKREGDSEVAQKTAK